MTNTLTISLALAERFISDSSDAEGAGEVVIQRADWEELRAILAAPAVERQEPSHWADAYDNTITASHKSHNEKLGGAPAMFVELYTQPLYTSPPAPVAVPHTMKSVMSAICAINGFPMLTSNQCHALAQSLNKVKELNR